jgi:predicted RNA methylase
MTFREWTIWEKNYLPSFPLKGKTVIDVGAGAGETAYFFLAHGASHVICVEPNPIALRFLRENTERNHWPTRIIPRRFDLSMLNSFKFDFAKMDAEGAEIQLLQLTRYPHPMSVEVHSLAVAEKLARKLGGKISHSAALGVWFLRINC